MENLFLLLIILIVLLVIIGYSAVNNRKMQKYTLEKIKNSYGQSCDREYKYGEYSHIAGYANNHSSEYTVDDITWNDLNMDEVYRQMNYTQSSAGDEYLYYLLRNPRLTGSAPEGFEEKIKYYSENEDSRLKLQTALYKCGRTGKYSIYDYLNNLDVIANENFNKDIWLLLLYAVAFGASFVHPFGMVALVGLLAYGGITYFSTKKRIEPYIISFAYVFRVLKGADTICGVKDATIKKEQERLKELKLSMGSFSRFSYIVMSQNGGTGNILEILLDYINIFFHLDIIKFFHMRNELKKNWDKIDEILTITGYIDSIIAIGCYRAYLQSWCVPEFDTSENGHYEATQIRHPLLTDPVGNNVDLKRGIILTGSNASGKSTMLKTLTIGAILAQSINTVPALYYRAPAYKVYTSLALTDDILAGESYYMTEIKSLKRIIDEGGQDGVPLLACVDEVLRGTNTIERIAASCVILKGLSSVKGMIITATHDLELARLLSDEYDNYHFEETIEGNDISFAYKMLPGAATTKNAIKLLEIVGYDEAITKEAARLAGIMERDGIGAI